jgi:hypothetical protein
MKIESNIPIPKIRSTGAQLKYPWDALKVGDSFFVPDGDVSALTSIGKQYFKNRNISVKIKCRTVTEDGVKGVRVWRVA